MCAIERLKLALIVILREITGRRLDFKVSLLSQKSTSWVEVTAAKIETMATKFMLAKLSAVPGQQAPKTIGLNSIVQLEQRPLKSRSFSPKPPHLHFVVLRSLVNTLANHLVKKMTRKRRSMMTQRTSSSSLFHPLNLVLIEDGLGMLRNWLSPKVNHNLILGKGKPKLVLIAILCQEIGKKLDSKRLKSARSSFKEELIAAKIGTMVTRSLLVEDFVECGPGARRTIGSNLSVLKAPLDLRSRLFNLRELL